MNNNFYDSKLIDWLTFVGTIIIAPVIQVFLQRYFFKYDKKLEKLRKKVKDLEIGSIRSQEKYGKEFAEFIIKNYEYIEKIRERFKEKTCSSCRAELERILKENFYPWEINKK